MVLRPSVVAATVTAPGKWHHHSSRAGTRREHKTNVNITLRQQEILTHLAHNTYCTTAENNCTLTVLSGAKERGVQRRSLAPFLFFSIPTNLRSYQRAKQHVLSSACARTKYEVCTHFAYFGAPTHAKYARVPRVSCTLYAFLRRLHSFRRFVRNRTKFLARTHCRRTLSH